MKINGRKLGWAIVDLLFLIVFIYYYIFDNNANAWGNLIQIGLMLLVGWNFLNDMEEAFK
jgi:hypothetical protein